MTLADIYIYTWDELIENEIRRALCRARAIYGAGRSVAQAINWDSTVVRKYFRLKPVDEIPGQPFFCLTLDDLHTYSHKKVVVMTKRAIVRALREELGSMRAVARFTGKNDKYLGGLMAEANST